MNQVRDKGLVWVIVPRALSVVQHTVAVCGLLLLPYPGVAVDSHELSGLLYCTLGTANLETHLPDTVDTLRLGGLGNHM